MTKIIYNWKCFIPILICCIGALLFSLSNYWRNDALVYQFFSPVFDETTSKPITSVSDIWTSQIDHYSTTNGRFIVHFIVQLFCALWGKTAFSIANALVWMVFLYLSVRFIDRSFNNTRVCWLASGLIWIIYLSLPFDPPFQINYIWVGTMNIGFLLIFFDDYKTKNFTLVWIAFYSLICGSLHEGYSLPISAGLGIYVIVNKFKLSLKKIILIIAYYIGTLVEAVAPGNFVRLSKLGNRYLFFTPNNLIENSALLFGILALLLIVFLSKKNSKLSSREKDISYICVTGAIFGYILCMISGSVGRGALPLCYLLSLIILIQITHRKIGLSYWWIISIWIISLVMSICSFIDRLKLSEFSEFITEEYARNENGIIYAPLKYVINYPEEITLYNYTYTKAARAMNHSKPPLRVYPDVMRDGVYKKDTNMIVKIAPQAWILIQSKTKPANFYIDKTLLPLILRKKMSPRKIDFSDDSDILVDSIGLNSKTLYVNRRAFLKSRIRMEYVK